MNNTQIGAFIAKERKAKKLTQAKLAEKLFVSEKTVSKWENGNGIPDTTSLPKLCEILGVSLNELLNGERLSSENYEARFEEKLLEIQKGKEESDKRLLATEIVLGVTGALFLLTTIFVSILVAMPLWARIVLCVVGFAVFWVAMFFCIWIEQKAGYYVCEKCGHKHVPRFWQTFFAQHMGRTRYMKCPNCKQKSWQKKVVK